MNHQRRKITTGKEWKCVIYTTEEAERQNLQSGSDCEVSWPEKILEWLKVG